MQPALQDEPGRSTRVLVCFQFSLVCTQRFQWFVQVAQPRGAGLRPRIAGRAEESAAGPSGRPASLRSVYVAEFYVAALCGWPMSCHSRLGSIWDRLGAWAPSRPQIDPKRSQPDVGQPQIATPSALSGPPPSNGHGPLPAAAQNPKRIFKHVSYKLIYKSACEGLSGL